MIHSIGYTQTKIYVKFSQCVNQIGLDATRKQVCCHQAGQQDALNSPTIYRKKHLLQKTLAKSWSPLISFRFSTTISLPLLPNSHPSKFSVMASKPNPINNENPQNTDASLVTNINFPIFISSESLHSILSHHSLIQHFHSSLPTVSSTINTPIRQNYHVSPSSSLLLMPSWSSSPSLPYIGVKLVTYFPQNSTLNLPSVHANYVLFRSTTGQPLASMDGTVLTLYRTACVSGVASKILARNDSKVLVMIGAGALAPHLIKAHLAANPSLQKVIIWNRTIKKATDLAEHLQGSNDYDGVCFESNESLEKIVELGDIVSCATNAEVPLVKGERLKAGTHLDLVGSFTHTMKECDDEAIRRGRVYVDNEAALVEAGELVGAFERGVIRKEDVGGNLVELIKDQKIGRRNSDEITVFKSVGSAVVDILAAQLVYQTFVKNKF